MTAVLLSGGKSRRFGTDKALATLEGRLLIERAHDVLQDVANQVVVSVDGPHTRYPVAARHISDAWEDCGPLSGIASVFSETTSDQLMVLASDLPGVTTETLLKLVEHHEPDVTVARNIDDARAQPLCAIWDRNVERSLVRFLDGGGRSVFKFLESLNVHFVDVSSEELLNINRPGDLKRGV